ncbi:MAG: YIP1 family protein [Oscillospiraceae bacterium]|nr:YIP1 family protein [Oscillospiraceae bacterium]
MVKISTKKLITFLAATLIVGMLGSFSAGALTSEAPYYSYRYDHWGSSVPTAQTYLPERTVSGITIGAGALKSPTDIFSTPDNEIYVLDSGNNRVLVMDRDMKLLKELGPMESDGKPMSMMEPISIFVSNQHKKIVIADKKAGVLIFDLSLKLIDTLKSPNSNILPKDFFFAPVKAIMDSAGIYYVVSANCYQGALQYDERGVFLGFYGSEKITLTADTLADYFWKQILTDKQAANMKRTVPVEFVSFTVDKNNFIYTVRKGNDVTQGQVKKLNALGENVIPEKVFGDRGTETMLADIAVDADGFITVLDSRSGRLFQYDGESNLMFAFGGKGIQNGLTQNPVAVESLGDKLLLLDGQTGLITLFTPTDFAKNVRKAVLLCDDGKYRQAMEPWGAVLKQDNLYELANRGLGKAYEGMGDFKKAAKFYKVAFERELYSEAFSEYRGDILRHNFLVFMLGIILSVVAPVIIVILRRRNKKSVYDVKIGRFHYPVYCMLHPFIGYTDLKERKKDSVLAANVLLLAYFIVSIIERQLTGFAFNYNRTDKFNLMFSLLSTIGFFAAFTICNWSITTIQEGKGRLKEIWNYCSYALLPYIIGTVVVVIMSNVLTTNEASFISMARFIVYAWTAIGLIMAIKEVHMYSLGRTIWTTILTLAGMLVILLICALSYNILSQLLEFIGSIYAELKMM